MDFSWLTPGYVNGNSFRVLRNLFFYRFSIFYSQLQSLMVYCHPYHRGLVHHSPWISDICGLWSTNPWWCGWRYHMIYPRLIWITMKIKVDEIWSDKCYNFLWSRWILDSKDIKFIFLRRRCILELVILFPFEIFDNIIACYIQYL